MIIKAELGPSFGQELAAAQVVSIFSWSEDPGQVVIADDLDDKTVEAIKGVIAKHDATRQSATNIAAVTDTQFIQALAEDKYKMITWLEAMNWGAQGILPAILTTALDKIPDDPTRNRAYMKARSAKSYIITDIWVQSILALLPNEVVSKMPGADLQDKLQRLFNFAATL